MDHYSEASAKMFDLLSCSGVFGSLVISDPDESRESERNSAIGVHDSSPSSVNWWDRKVRSLDLPNLEKKRHKGSIDFKKTIAEGECPTVDKNLAWQQINAVSTFQS